MTNDIYTVKTVAEGKTVVQYETYFGKTKRTIVRTCNTEDQAKAVANYISLYGGAK